MKISKRGVFGWHDDHDSAGSFLMKQVRTTETNEHILLGAKPVYFVEIYEPERNKIEKFFTELLYS